MRIRRELAVFLMVAFVFGGAVWWAMRQSTDDAEDSLAHARLALASGDHRRAEQAAARAIELQPDAPAPRLIAARAALAGNRKQDALRWIEAVSGDDSDEGAQALYLAGELFLDAGRASAAESRFRCLLSRRPNHVNANRSLANLLAIVGRRWEAQPYLFALLKAGRLQPDELLLLGDGRTDFDAVADRERFREGAPDDPRPLLGEARVAFRENQLPKAESLLRRIVVADPNCIEAQAWLGRVLERNDDPNAWATWHSALPAAADEHPLVWVVRAQWAEKASDPTGAVRCYLEAVRRDPNQDLAVSALARLLEASSDPRADLLHQRANQLYDLMARFHAVYSRFSNDRAFHGSPEVFAQIKSIVALLESLDRIWEASAWCHVVLSIDPRESWARTDASRFKSVLDAEPDYGLVRRNPVSAWNLSAYPLPDWTRLEVPTSDEMAAPTSRAVRFEDLARTAGIGFSYCSGSTPQREGRRIHETTGGGVGVLDYDGDCWPDIYFTQGGTWPETKSGPILFDELYRNLGDGSFAPVAAHAGIVDGGFGQGVAAGDVNQDGFADLYVANIGANCLYVNNGDGTFSEMSAQAGIVAAGWTTSCAIADLDGDAMPELFDVNYVQGDDVFTRTCVLNGHSVACPPLVFSAEDDRLWHNVGDGSFMDISAPAGIVAPNGNGLGIVVADMSQSGLLSVFVANDATPNFLFVNRAAARGAPPEFTDRAVAAGVALDRDGRAQASMGIACDDFDGDARLDFFVTGFYRERNILYCQQSGFDFIDRTLQSGLAPAGFNLLGFGTQAIDGDLDGWPDLVVSNGHVEDLRFRGEPFQMRPQYYRNLGSCRFVELPPESLGDFFQGTHLGRGMARIDWDRDGRDDVVISHLDEPAALLTNRATSAGHHLSVQLRGVTGERDAIGASVTITCGDRTIMRQLIAGDGYQASNQRQLVFGLGMHERVDRLRVQWPGGATQTFASLPADSEWLLIEGDGEIHRLPRSN